MYSYIFWVIYEKNKLKDKSDWLSRSNASGIVFITLLVHLLLAAKVIDAFYGRKVLPPVLVANKGLLSVVLLGCIALIQVFFSKERIERLRRKYENRDDILNDNGGFVVAILVFIPMIILLILG